MRDAPPRRPLDADDAPNARVAGLKSLAFGVVGLTAVVGAAVSLETTSVKLQALGLIASTIAGYGAVQVLLGPRLPLLRWLVGVPAGAVLFVGSLQLFAPWVFDAL